jgi:hypothetical protein
MFRGSEWSRLITMVVLLGVVGLLIVNARNPNNWRWFIERRNGEPEVAAQPATGKSKPSDAPPGGPVTPGPTDEDPDQRADSSEEFQAVTDGTIGIQPEEMLAYWRLLLWTEHQSFDMLQRRSRGNVFFTELMQFPEKFRGRLVSMDLNVRRVLAYDLEETPLGKMRLYEVWGFTEDSKAWLYVAVTAHLPEGMSVGAEVYEKVRLTGYFFKLQGYYEAGAKPRAPALKAPLLVGRMTRYAPVSMANSSPQTDVWSLVVVAGAGLVLLVIVATQLLVNRRAARHHAARRDQARQSVSTWLQKNEDGPPSSGPLAAPDVSPGAEYGGE